MSLMRIDASELARNPSNRLPVALCLDVSSSMAGEPIKELNDGIRLFIEAVGKDDCASASVELLVVTFADTPRVQTEFSTVDKIQSAKVTATGGSTDLGGGVSLALAQLGERKELYRRLGIDYFQPWLVLMTDGQPTTKNHNAASTLTLELEGSKKLTVFPIGIGPGADMDVLRKFSQKKPPLKLRGLKFREFFQWLSASASTVSASRPGEQLKLDTAGIADWGEVS